MISVVMIFFYKMETPPSGVVLLLTEKMKTQQMSLLTLSTTICYDLTYRRASKVNI